MFRYNIFFASIVAYAVGHQQFMFDYGPNAHDSELPHQNGAVASFQLTTPLNFFGRTNSLIYVDSNGVIWPGWYCGGFCDAPARTPFPVNPGNQIIACYWAAVDLSANPNSHVYYRVVKDSSTKLLANDLLQNAYGKSQFDTTSNDLVIIIATWVNVTYEGGNAHTPTNTFQCAVLSDGTNSYTLHSYTDLNWANSPVEMQANNPALAAVDSGFDDPTYNNYVLPFSRTTNVNTNLFTTTNFVKPGPLAWYMLTMGVPYVPYNMNLTGVSYRSCSSVSDPHYTSFDSLYIDSSFGGNNGIYTITQIQQPNQNYIMVAMMNCHYMDTYPQFMISVLVQPCSPGNVITCPFGYKFILYNNEQGALYSQIELDVYFDHYQLTLTGTRTAQTQLTGQWSCPANTCPPGVSFNIAQISNGYQLSSNFGLSVQFVVSSLIVTLPVIPELENNVFGYCGNLDGIAANDNYCWNPSLRNANEYETCWPESHLQTVTTTTPGLYQCFSYPPQVVEKVKDTQPASTPEWVLEKCSVLIDPNGVFGPCQSVSSNIYMGCLADVAVTNADDATFCADATQLAQLCAALNVTNLNWRSASLCPITCPANAHYSASFSPCIATCDNPFGPLFCSKPPTEGCLCDEGFVSQGNQCITLDQCSGCLNDAGILVSTGAQWITSDCARQCTCNGNGIVDCIANQCDQNAACVNGGASSSCACNANYYGDGYFCSTTNNCSPYNNCQNGAQCITQQAGYKCLCKPGYTSQYCDVDIDYCTNNPCANGICTSVGGSYQCTCKVGYSGQNCDQITNWCASFPCTNLATCVSYDLTYQCLCQPGYTGQNCEIFEETTILYSTQPPPTTQPPPPPRTTTPRAPPTHRATTVAPPATSNAPPASTPSQGLDCTNLPDGDYSNPNNPCSHTYYICSNGDSYEMTCPSNLYYDIVIDECMSCSKVPACQGLCP